MRRPGVTSACPPEATATTVRRLGELQRGLLEAYEKDLPLVVGVAFDPSSVARGVISGVGAVINGLYAAGELVGGLFYHNYPSGSGLSSGAVFGRTAGAGAAKFGRAQTAVTKV